MTKKYFLVDGYCSVKGKPIGIQCEDCGDKYYAVGCVSGGAGGGAGTAEAHNGKFLNGGSFKCKHCGNDEFVQCSCGTFLCIGHNDAQITCPACGKTSTVTTVSADEMPVSTANSKKQ